MEKNCEKGNPKLIDKSISKKISHRRKLSGFTSNLVKIIAVITSLYNLYIGFFGVPRGMISRPIHLMLTFLILFIIVPGFDRENHKKVPWYDWIFCILVVLTMGYTLLKADWFMQRYLYVTPLQTVEIITGVLVIVLVLEAGRRTIGMALPIICSVFLLYAYFGKYLPYPWGHTGVSIPTIIEHTYLSLDGIWTTPIYVTATYVSLFILFGAFLASSGMSDFFSDLSMSIAGKSPGGGAKVAVFSSGFMGMISGSTVANVVTTGSFTIPMMKKKGFGSRFAGAVEAVASTGGQFMPPIMGAAAFIMAEFTGIPYIKIILHALIPATLYFFTVYFIIHFRSLKVGLRGLNKDEIPSFIKVLKKGYIVLPLVVIVWFLAKGYTPMRAALFGILAIMLLGLIFQRREFISILIEAFEQAPKSVVPITAATANAGIIIGLITLTGLGARLSSIILEISGGILPIVLGLSIILAIILGMGMPSSGAYIIMSTLLVPGIINMNVSVIQAHMFVFYFTGLSSITPPVGIASYAAAGISGADPWKTGLDAFMLGIAAYIVPIVFIYNPALLFIGTTTEIIIAVLTTGIGLYALASAMQGWMKCKTKLYERLSLYIAAILLIFPGTVTNIIGLLICTYVIIFQNKKVKKLKEVIEIN